MSYLQNTIKNFKANIKSTMDFGFAIPSSIYSLFTTKDDGYEAIITVPAKILTIFALPILLPLVAVVFAAAILAAAVQAITFPFQCFFAAARDLFSSKKHQGHHDGASNNAEYDHHAESIDAHDREPGHFPHPFAAPKQTQARVVELEHNDEPVVAPRM